MKTKTGQIKFGETLGIIIIVYIIIVVGFVWYNNQNSKDIENQLEKQAENKAFERYNYILKLNLIHKSELGYIDEEFDRTSLKAMSNYTNSSTGKEYFRTRLGTSKIEIKLYDLELNSIENITIYNNTPIKNKYDKTSYKNIILVSDNIKKTKYIGYIEVLDFRVKE